MHLHVNETDGPATLATSPAAAAACRTAQTMVQLVSLPESAAAHRDSRQGTTEENWMGIQIQRATRRTTSPIKTTAGSQAESKLDICIGTEEGTRNLTRAKSHALLQQPLLRTRNRAPVAVRPRHKVVQDQKARPKTVGGVSTRLNDAPCRCSLSVHSNSTDSRPSHPATPWSTAKRAQDKHRLTSAIYIHDQPETDAPLTLTQASA